MKNVKSQKKTPEIIIRGGGDIATGTILRLHRVGFKVLVLETAQPTAIRRTVSFSEAVTFNECEVEGSRARLIENISQCPELWQKNEIPVLVDPEMRCLENLSDVILVDAILAKKGGQYKTFSSLSYSIALGPGFSAGEDVDAVIETCRGHNLGRIIRTGKALANTGLPGEIGGFSAERVLYTPVAGTFRLKKEIGDIVCAGEVIAHIDDVEIVASISGILRGLLPNNFKVRKGLKMADIDPRKEELDNCYKISEKARCISGAVLETILVFLKNRE